MRRNLRGGKADELGWPPERYNQDQLAMGIRVEMEHTNDPDLACQIAMDHLAEQVLSGQPQDYYTRLARMEGDMHVNAKWSTRYINDLPDSAFAYIESGGSKDADGKTIPRSLRHLPYVNHLGAVDVVHLRVALARLNQVEGLSQRKERQIRSKLQRILAEHGGYQHAANHALDYSKAMEVANAELARGTDEMGVLEALRRAGFRDDVFNQAMALYATEQHRQRVARIESGPTVRSAFGRGMARAAEEDPFWRSHVQNPSFTEEEAFAALQTRLATPMKYAASRVEGGLPPDQATRVASAEFGLGDRDTQILHYIMDAYQLLETPQAPPIRHRFEPTVPPMRAQRHHFAVNRAHRRNRTALDIGTSALHVPTGSVVSVVGYEGGNPVVMGSNGQTRVVSHTDLSRDAYELQVAMAMTQLMDGTDPAVVVKNLMDDDVNEEFALTAMEDAVQRMAEVQ